MQWGYCDGINDNNLDDRIGHAEEIGFESAVTKTVAQAGNELLECERTGSDGLTSRISSVCMSVLFLQSTNRVNFSKKSAPNMGWIVSAIVNDHVNLGWRPSK
jgi:hypothetical protein